MREPARPKDQTEWRVALDALPESDSSIPAFFFGHGSPSLLIDPADTGSAFSIREMTGTSSRLAMFLADFGPTLLKKYRPKAIAVFSAHWETDGEILVTDYGENQPLLMDYYGFGKELYQVVFRSSGAAEVSQRVVEILTKAGINARKTPRSEPRGIDGRGFHGSGLDHGVFVPFKIMFGDEFDEVPIVQVSICGSLNPITNFDLGKAMNELRAEGTLILSGGLTIHNLRKLRTFDEASAPLQLRRFQDAIYEAAEQTDPEQRKDQLLRLVEEPGFRQAHPREEHFIPIYIAAGAGYNGKAKILNAQYAAPTIAFGV